MTKQLNANATEDWIFVGIISIAFFGVGFIFFLKYHDSLDGIIKEMKKLDV